MTKPELAAHCANLHLLMQGQDSMGRKRSSWLVDEFQRSFDELKKLIKDEPPPDAKEPQDAKPQDPPDEEGD